MNHYCVFTTFECNWNCPYCYCDTHSKSRTFEDVMNQLLVIEDGSTVTLTGGEPGLLTTEQLMTIIKHLRDKGCHVDVNTNGEIFKHEEVIGEVDDILYHCSINMDIDDVINRDYMDRVDYLVVVTDNNIHNLQPFLEKHDEIDFKIIPARRAGGIKGGDCLSKKNILTLVKKYRDRLTQENLSLMLDFCGCEERYKVL